MRAAAGPLRVGILAPGTSLGRWQRVVLEELRAGGDVELAVLVTDASPRERRSLRSRLARLGGRRALWQLYNNRWVARRAESVARVDCRDLLGALPTMAVVPERVGRFSQHFSDEALAELRAHDLDVLLRFGFGILRGSVLGVARHGIWSFHHDDERVIRGGPPSFWEVADGLPTTGVLFQRLTDRLDAGVPLARATLRTIGYSYPRNRDRAAFGAAGLPAKVARAVRRGWLDPSSLPEALAEAPVRRDPTNRQMAVFLARHVRRVVGARVTGVVAAPRWGVGVAARGPGSPLGALPRVTWLPERQQAGYFADPFPHRRDGVTAVMVEEFDERSALGVISALRQDGDRWELVTSVIDPGVHASYPFLVDVDDELYCVPETARAATVEAWRCVRFPDQWVRHATLLADVALLDPTIVEWQGRWWLFGTRRERNPDAELWAWHADHPLGPWSPHAANPLKVDVTSARPAGTPFVVDGALHRPAQDCSRGYGGAVTINRVDRLDEHGFDEHVIERIVLDDGPYRMGTHTLSVGAGLVAVDARRRVFDVHRSTRELAARLRRR